MATPQRVLDLPVSVSCVGSFPTTGSNRHRATAPTQIPGVSPMTALFMILSFAVTALIGRGMAALGEVMR